MKIVFTGGGTGGHFYPIIAVAEALNKIIDEEKIIEHQFYFLSDSAYDQKALFVNEIKFERISTGKLRLYFSLDNFFDLFKTFFGIIESIWKLYKIYPDVIFSKGGYASFPVLVAARILRIPVMIHESDSFPGKVNRWAGKFAKKIALSYPEAFSFFPKEKTAWVGQPIRQEIRQKAKSGAFEYLKLDFNLPTLLILGGSQGAEIINDNIIEILPELLSHYQIIHQLGKKNFAKIEEILPVILEKKPELKERYKFFDFLNPLALKMAAGATTVVISRAGSTIFEIANWGIPAIIIPITKSNGDHQRKNAYNYARAGGCLVIEENNLTPHVLMLEIDNLIKDEKKRELMSQKAIIFAKTDAADKIAQEIVNIALSHEK